MSESIDQVDSPWGLYWHRVAEAFAPEGRMLRTDTPPNDIQLTSRGGRYFIPTREQTTLTFTPITVGTFYPWFSHVAHDLQEILKLPDNWDSYGARRIDKQLVFYAASKVLAPCMQTNTPPPTTVPLNKGGIMFEWHREGIDLEVRVEAPGSVFMYYFNEQSRKEVDQQLSFDLSPLRIAINELTRRG